ncbi:uncharacterized protein J4E84_009414 [Alternaria hordeiaustralica]|uniref:uncharacterized protein n=1 Tax=Alternaria hordeiaustralica TaxID=1187925 RepID=UPI0020C4898D|nr:uncharacterized protein J4E84_009414 [Alternaria hordeiaustralica]KAI4676819.1 hypothetical protein J4E84_009414 [Alternaria hordeiaustralica]
MDDIVQAHAHAKEEDQGSYDEDETEQLKDLATYLDVKHAAGLETIQQLKTLSSIPTILALITDPELRAFLCAPDVEKHFATFKYCSELFPVMGSYIQQRAPNKLFVETFLFLQDKAKKATALLECFQIVLECLLNYEPSRPEEHFNGSEARLEFFGDMLKCMITSRDLEVPPIAFHFHENSFVVPEATIQQLEENQDVPQACTEKQEKNSEKKPSRKERGILNIHHLAFDPESLKGLLDDEPSRNFEAVHVAFPEDENAVGIDVEDEQGNKLVWRDGKSHIIFAVTKAEDKTAVKEMNEQPTKPKDELQTEPTKTTYQPTGGFGFDYSDEEDDTLLNNEVAETKAIAVESVDMSSDPSPYLCIPSSPPVSAAECSFQSHSSSASSPSSPSLPALPNTSKNEDAETSQPKSGSSSPSSRKRKSLSSESSEDKKGISSDEEEDKQHSDPPMKRSCTTSLSSSSSSSRSTTPVEATLRNFPSAPASPLADLPPLPSSPASPDSSSLSSVSSYVDSASSPQSPPAPLPPQPTTPQHRMQTRAMTRSASTTPAPPDVASTRATRSSRK